MSNVLAFLALVFLCLTATGSATAAEAITVTTLPAKPLIELGKSNKLLNFDFGIHNASAVKLHLVRMTMFAYDASHRLIERLQVDSNGFPSSLETIPERDVDPHATLGIFNPFYAFPRNVSIASLKYEFAFSSANGERTITYRVTPLAYADHAVLRVPLTGRMIVLDGHDFYAHHRRQNIFDPAAVAVGVTGNPVRYAMDFVYVDSDGAMYRGDPRDKRNWFGYGKAIYAPAAGRVAAVVNDVAEPTWDGHRLTKPHLPKDASPFGMGNYVIIDHGFGEFSVFAHIIPGSIPVHPGERVAQGTIIGRLGTSDAGDPTYQVEPHLHYMLMNGPKFYNSEGLPAYFGPFTLIQGARQTQVQRGAIDTGDIIEAP